MTNIIGLIHVILIIIPNVYKAFSGINHRIFRQQSKNFCKNTIFQ